MFRALSCPSSGAVSNCSRSLRLLCKCGGGCVSIRPRLETRPPPHSHGSRRLRLQFETAPDDGHDSARNMLSDVYVTKQKMLRFFVKTVWIFYLNIVCKTLTSCQSNIYFGTESWCIQCSTCYVCGICESFVMRKPSYSFSYRSLHVTHRSYTLWVPGWV
jgi:hypothetical protein